MHPPRKLQFCRIAANAARVADVSANETEAVEAANADDGWMKLSPYGDWPNPAGLQRMDREAAETMANALSGAWARVKRAFAHFAGVSAAPPIYQGHPDHGGEYAGNPAHEDKNVYGRVEELQARDDGLWGRMKWEAAGNALRAAGRKLYFSPRWNMAPLAAAQKIFRPVELLSVGLTPTPRIAGAAANANTEKSAMTPEQLAKLRQLLALPETATADEVIAAANAQADIHAAAVAANNTLEERLRAANAALANERTAHAATEQARAAAVAANATDAANAAIEVKAARIVLAKHLLDAAASAGRLTPAQRPEWEAAFASAANSEQFDAKAAELAAAKPVLKTTAATANLHQRKPEIAAANARMTSVVTAVRKHQDEHKCSYDEAWNAVQKAQPALFEGMQQPEKPGAA